MFIAWWTRYGAVSCSRVVGYIVRVCQWYWRCGLGVARSLPFKLTRSVGSIVALIPFSGVSRLSTSILVLYWSILLILSVILVLMILILSRLVLVLDSPIPILRSVIMILYCRLILILWSSIPILYSCISILCRFIIVLCRLISILWVSVLILYNPIPILHSLIWIFMSHMCVTALRAVILSLLLMSRVFIVRWCVVRMVGWCDRHWNRAVGIELSLWMEGNRCFRKRRCWIFRRHSKVWQRL